MRVGEEGRKKLGKGEGPERRGGSGVTEDAAAAEEAGVRGCVRARVLALDSQQ